MMCHSLVHELGREQLKTTKELLDIVTWHTSGEEAVGATFTLGNVGTGADSGQAMPTKTTIKGGRKGAKGGKKGQKHRTRHLATMASNDNGGEEIDNSGEEFVAMAERDFKRWTQPPKDHFEKILEVACLNHPCPVKHKLRDCTMMKKFITSGVPSGGDKPRRDLGGKRVTPRLGETEVGTIIDWSQPKTRDATWLVETQAPYALR
jgi:hypothetical protein